MYRPAQGRLGQGSRVQQVVPHSSLGITMHTIYHENSAPQSYKVRKHETQGRLSHS